MKFVVLTHAPAFTLEGTVHRVCSDPAASPTAVRTVCGRELENTPTTATVALTNRPRGKVFAACKACQR